MSNYRKWRNISNQNNLHKYSIHICIMENDEPVPRPSSEIDQLTMALLMNKQTYSKYISKQDPEKAKILQEQTEEINTYRKQIMDITQKKIENPQLQVTNDVDDIFEAYTKTLIRHFKQKELENSTQYGDNEKEEEESMFGKINDNPTHQREPTSSYWGKQKVLKQDYLSQDFFNKK